MLHQSNNIKIETLTIGTPECALYIELTKKKKIKIGSGEASVLAFAKCCHGMTASNNLKDITYYLKKYNLINRTTADILYEMMKNGIISEMQGNQIWENMIQKKQMLPEKTFSDYILSSN
ncbi:hypothetical protein MmiHf6_11370 [Methanimicrococcus hongohii]|uniref:Uncharacterized protein n=1 Tax=Methanimicrococcus hongohii TaxID=3028295 RepID=A0AA96V006_9EURY|nr:hypothetical protein [Methanimicrococcus sp. Hf6]WNY23816.1 hypothetical protein MmiHf6_11370 [Methanimicrococcus sp. Hf6]